MTFVYYFLVGLFFKVKFFFEYRVIPTERSDEESHRVESSVRFLPAASLERQSKDSK